MESALYVSLSGQLALERRLDTVARNVANLDTAGYRADKVKFSSLVTNAGKDKVTFSSLGRTYIARESGAIKQTGNPLDVAIEGNGWLSIKTGNGVAYTRDGRLQMGADGVLRSLAGNAILDAGGADIILNPTGGTPSITRDGTITQDGQISGIIGLYNIPQDAKLSRLGNSAITTSKPAAPVLDMAENGIRQGYIEGANVNPVQEITKLIEITRSFEGLNSAVQSAETVRQSALRKLGEG